MPKRIRPNTQRSKNNQSVLLALLICGMLLFLFFDFLSLLRTRAQRMQHPSNAPAELAATADQRTDSSCDVLLDESERAFFDRLYDDYQAHSESVRYSSNIQDYLDCAAIEEIIAHDLCYVPFVIEKIRNGDHFLQGILAEMTGDHSERYADELGCGFGSQCEAQAWVEWWETSDASDTRR